MSNSLLNRMKSAGSIKYSDVLSESYFFTDRSESSTTVPIINVALSGRVDGGLGSGVTFLAGPSKHFKSLLGLLLVQAYLDKHKDGICLFYDCEFGISPEYAKSLNLDLDRVIHIPIEDIEMMTNDMTQRVEEIKRGDKVIIFVDSIGNLASKREVDNAIDGKSALDMTRAKALKSFFRIITTKFNVKDICGVFINHTYLEQTMYPKTIMSGGTGAHYSANTVLIIGKSQEKDGAELVGSNFTLNVEKSRIVREKSKLSFSVLFDGGLNKWSGLMDLALEFGYVNKVSNGWYSKVDMKSGSIEDKKYRLADTNTASFWGSILNDNEFREKVRLKYQVATEDLIRSEDIPESIKNI